MKNRSVIARIKAKIVKPKVKKAKKELVVETPVEVETPIED